MHSRLKPQQILPYKQSYFKKHLGSDCPFNMDGIVGPAGTRTIAQVRNKLRKSALQPSYFENRVNCATQSE
jgi:hypothetical protein